ncbi:winged helix DNA-binding domain-containing protein [Pseudonocardia ailaonensis]|uniref:Winged helix DNA-binding domain-containing protein n=1 Tax=Pseudonocardia ailaonensis TaxID=367279 RepID=A0ABN2MQT7_9PSEU
MRITWRQVTRWRAVRQLLTTGEPDPVEVARRVGGIHAQVASCSTGIAALRGATGVDDALADRTLVRTWAMRGTLHLLPADELGLWCAALTERESRRRFPPSFERENGVDGDTLHAVTASIGRVLGAEPLTRAELVERVVDDLGRPEIAEAMGKGWGVLLKPAAARGYLCSGPDGTFVSPAGLLGRPLDQHDPAEAEQAALTRFLAANGPVTVEDVARWWGEQPAPARRRLRGAERVGVEIDGEPGFLLDPADADELAATPADGDHPADGPFLLPGFDPWTIAPLSHRRHAVPEGREKEVSRAAGWITPVLVVDGRVAGVWEREGGRIVVRPFAKLPAGARRAVERLGEVGWA